MRCAQQTQSSHDWVSSQAPDQLHACSRTFSMQLLLMHMSGRDRKYSCLLLVTSCHLPLQQKQTKCLARPCLHHHPHLQASALPCSITMSAGSAPACSVYCVVYCRSPYPPTQLGNMLCTFKAYVRPCVAIAHCYLDFCSLRINIKASKNIHPASLVPSRMSNLASQSRCQKLVCMASQSETNAVTCLAPLALGHSAIHHALPHYLVIHLLGTQKPHLKQARQTGVGASSCALSVMCMLSLSSIISS